MVESSPYSDARLTLPEASCFAVVLVEPRIPQNVGNIARLCTNTGTPLWIVGSVGFVAHDKHLQRAGMDYLDKTVIHHVDDWQAVEDQHPGWQAFFFSSFGKQNHFSIRYPEQSLLVFGCETHGLPKAFLRSVADRTVYIPMTAQGRSLNLASSVAIILYDALKQNIP